MYVYRSIRDLLSKTIALKSNIKPDCLFQME
nr:MAG TPA: hypothetical protein [Caudoviricetes sp.]